MQSERIQLGQRGEDLATEKLVASGYQLIARNVQCGHGEIDIIAWDKQTLCFVEVRTKESTIHGHPLETVDSHKQRRLCKSAAHYMERWKGPWPELRFDVIGIVLDQGPSITLVKEAFEA